MTTTHAHRPQAFVPGAPALLLLLCGCGWAAEGDAITGNSKQAGRHDRAAVADTIGATAKPRRQSQELRAWGRLDASVSGLGDVFDVYVDVDGVPQRFAHIGADGVFQLAEPSGADLIPAPTRAMADVFDDCASSTMLVEHRDARVDALALYAMRPGEDRRYRLLATDSSVYAEWNAGLRPAFESGNATLDVYIAEHAASARGLCHLHSDDVIDTDVQFAPGLNLVRTRYDRFLMVGRDPNSEAARQQAGITVRSEAAFPDDMRWFLIERVSTRAPVPHASED